MRYLGGSTWTTDTDLAGLFRLEAYVGSAKELAWRGKAEGVMGTSRLSSRALALAREVDHPVYDCLYLALAELKETRVVTADRRLLGKLEGTPYRELVRPLAIDRGAI
jgi:predicted nucleic acid-binding protein